MKRPLLLHDDKVKSRYWDPALTSYVTRVQPGFYTVARGTEAVMASVGAGMCVCVRDPYLGIGGLAQFLLPLENETPSTWDGTAVSAMMRFGNVAMEYLITAVCKAGGERHRLELMAFGGARLAVHMHALAECHVSFIRAYAEAEQLPVVEEDVGDNYAREVAYYPGMGTAQVRTLTHSAAQTIIEREVAYLVDLTAVPTVDDVILF